MKIFTKPILLTLAFVATLLPQISQAQDPRFSQYYNSPWNMNPAMTGMFTGRYRIVANYRDQWNSFLSPTPFRTYSVNSDFRVGVNSKDYFAFGLGLLHDEAGTAEFTQNRGNLGLSFLKQLSGGRNAADHFISAGAQLGLGQNKMDWSKLWFSNQFNSGTEVPDPTLSSGENNQVNSTGTFLDFNAGALWYVLLENEGFIYAGAAMHHINQPKISFMNDDGETLYARVSTHVGAQLPLTNNFFIQPAIQVMKQGPALEVDPGFNVRYTNHDRNELALRAGIWGRIGNKLDKGIGMDALTFLAMLELNRISLGLSYDVTVSTLTRANNSRGAFEVSLIYYHPENRRLKVKCPRL